MAIWHGSSVRSRRRQTAQKRASLTAAPDNLTPRALRLEPFEERLLFAINPTLVGIYTSEATLLANTLSSAPRELTLKFDSSLDASTLLKNNVASIQVTRAGADKTLGTADDVLVSPAYYAIGDNPNEVVIRFAQTAQRQPLTLQDGTVVSDTALIDPSTPDDQYRVTIYGSGANPLKGSNGLVFNNGVNVSQNFTLSLAPQVVAVVPQPISRDATTRALSQAADQIVVYFNANDPLDQTLATTKTFYQLIRTTDGTGAAVTQTIANPTSVTYDAASGKAVLTFASGVLSATVASGDRSGVYRLRVGTSEPLPLPTVDKGFISDAGSSLATAHNFGTLFTNLQGMQSISLSGHIGGSPVQVIYPGGDDEPGVRNITVEDHLLGGAGTSGNIPVIAYNFKSYLGTVLGAPAYNNITPEQKQRAREVLSYYAHYLGVAFVETDSSGFTIATGDPRVVDPNISPTAIGGIAGGGLAVMNGAVNWGESEPTGGYFTTAMHEIGHILGLGHTYELPPLSVQGSSESLGDSVGAEPVFPGDSDILLGQYLYPTVGNDINFYKFSLPRTGQLSLETIAERMRDVNPNDTPSQLDTVISVYDANGNLLARNDDYYGDDSALQLTLSSGTYYVAITSTGNTNFNPAIAGTGAGGTTQGDYKLNISFTPTVTSGIRDQQGSQLDGDTDGSPGGAYNFWFSVASSQASGPKTIFVDKVGPQTPSGALGTIGNPYKNIVDALAQASPHDVVRIMGNGGDDRNLATQGDNKPYQIGYDNLGQPLSDGATFNVPRDVTVMIDSGAIIKMRYANIDVGTSQQGIDRSGGALQVLGVPTGTLNDSTDPLMKDDAGAVYFTSYYKANVGAAPNNLGNLLAAGNWGGLVFRNDPSLKVAGDTDYESTGIFLNYVNQANLSYGGGKVRVGGDEQVYAPIHMVTSRPTISFNTITNSADAAVSADPNSFQESTFRGAQFSYDYTRSGPKVVGNTLAKDSINGLFVRIRTSVSGAVLDTVTTSARFSTTDMPYVIKENLLISGNPGGFFIDGQGKLQARENGRLEIDPGVVVKLGGARIETQIGSQLIAEGTADKPIIFTSLLDDRYGGGGTFDTNNDNKPNTTPTEPAEGDWGGLFFGPLSVGSIDHALITFAGGATTIEGGFGTFDPVEIHQAQVRLANSRLERNGAPGGDNRNGRSTATPAVIFVRGAQPVIINNVIQNNDTGSSSTPKNTAAISINVNSLNYYQVSDWGRSTGPVNIQVPSLTNSGPLVRDNKLSNNPINGMIVRGGTITTNVIWDDTDIVHVLQDEVIAGNQFSVLGTVRLQSSPTESLVVKLQGNTAGFTASGTALDINDRIGGTVEVVGTPNHPVILTSLLDNTVGAGFTPSGVAQTDTRNIGNATGTSPAAGDWRSIKLDTLSNDANIDYVNELEQAWASTGDTNSAPTSAQFIGNLAKDVKSGDDNNRLGFEIHGSISQATTPQRANAGDADVYSFKGTAGTAVWFDIDKTAPGLDTVIELVDANGAVVARNDNSLGAFTSPNFVGIAKPLDVGGPYGNPDYYSTNTKDAGMRLDLPGTVGTVNTYYVRVRANSNNLDVLAGGTTTGAYQLQIRLQQLDVFPGSLVRNADIRYSDIGVEVIGKPERSPLMGDTAETSTDHSTIQTAQDLGNLLTTDSGALSVAGNLSAPGQVDWYKIALNYDLVQAIAGASDGGHTLATMFQINYADGLTRPDTTLSVFDSVGHLVYIGRDSDVPDSLPRSSTGSDQTNLTHGSYGSLDATIGSVDLKAGSPTVIDPFTGKPTVTNKQYTYYVAVSAMNVLPTVLDATFKLNATNPLVRLAPISSVQTIFADQVDVNKQSDNPAFPGNSTASLNLNAVPLQLGDIVGFLNTGTDLYTVNPFTGQITTAVTNNSYPTYGLGVGDLPNAGATGGKNVTYRDIAMRDDGRLMTYPVGIGDNSTPGTNGRYTEIDSGFGTVRSTAEGGLGEQGYSMNTSDLTADQPVNDDGTFNFTGNTKDIGIAVEGMTFGTSASFNDRTVYVVGNRSAGNGTISATKNLLYAFNANTGQPYDFDLQSNYTSDHPIYQPFNTDYPGTGTAVIPRGILNTGTYFVAVPATNPNGALTSLGLAQDLKDGASFVIGNKSFEFELGPVLSLDNPLTAAQNGIASLRDGMTFIISGPPANNPTTKVYELKSGPVINVANSGQVLNGNTFAITDTNGLTVTFEFGTAGTVAAGHVPVATAGTAAGVAANILTAINVTSRVQYPSYLVQASRPDTNSTRISLTNDLQDTNNLAVDVSGTAGLTKEGSWNTSQPGNIAVRFEETSSFADFGNSVVNAVNTTPEFAGGSVNASFARDRISFLGAVGASFTTLTDASSEITEAGTAGVGSGKIAVRVNAASTAQQVAAELATRITGAGIPLAPIPGGSSPGNVSATQEGTYVRISGAVPTSNLTALGSDGAGTITGIATLPVTSAANPNLIFEDDMFGVSSTGAVYKISNYDDIGSPDGKLTLLNVIKDQNGQPIQFTGLTSGPPNVEAGRYKRTLFATDINGNIWALTDQGQLSPIFLNGAVKVSTGIFNLQGITFSSNDQNLWHVSQTDITPNSPSAAAPGHTANGSFYFGLDDPRRLRDDLDQTDSANYLDGNNLTERVGNYSLVQSYNMPGGAYGSLMTGTFDLSDYSATDKPTLYFNYALDTEGASAKDSATSMRDSFRVFISSDGANWSELATNNSALTSTDAPKAPNAELPKVPSVSGGAYESDRPNQGVQELFDPVGNPQNPQTIAPLPPTTAVQWRQARIDLGDFAGKSNLQIRFDFSTAGSMGIGAINQGGVYLAGVAGKQLTDGQSFSIDNTVRIGTTNLGDPINATTNYTFNFRSGFIMQVPTGGGPSLQSTETFTLTGNGASQTYQLLAGGSADAGNIGIQYTANQTPEQIAQTIANAINANPTAGVSVVRVGAQLQFVGATSVTQSANHKLVLQGSALPGTLAPSDITFTIDMTAEQVATQVAAAIDRVMSSVAAANVLLAPSAGGTAAVEGETVTVTGTGGSVKTYQLTKTGTVAAGNIAVLINNGQTAAQVATALVNAINANAPSGVVAYVAGTGVQIAGATALSRSANSSLTLNSFTLNNFSSGLAATDAADNFTTSKVTGRTIRLFGHNVVSAGPLPYSNTLPGDQYGNFYTSDFTSLDSLSAVTRGRDNGHQGVYLDDVIVGFAGRGEQVVNGYLPTPDYTPANDSGDPHPNDPNLTDTGGFAPNSITTFDVIPRETVNMPAKVLTGPYQLTIRRGTDGVTAPVDINNRFADGFTLYLPPASQIYDGQTFSITVESGTFTFEFDTNNSVAAGNYRVALPVNGDATAVATAVRDAINNVPADKMFPVKAGLNISSASVKTTRTSLNIFGAANVAPGAIEMKTFGIEAGNLPVLGDQTPLRVQGQTIISATRITDSARAGIAVTPVLSQDALGNYQVGVPGRTGSVLNLPVLNNQRLVPGVTIKNNLIIAAGQAGIFFSGAPLTDIQNNVPFGRIINNTIAQSAIGIAVANSASPTIVNNAFYGNGTAISVDSSSNTTVVGGSIYQSNTVNLSGGSETAAIVLQPSDPLFVDTSKRNYYLKLNSLAIDASIEAVPERQAIKAITGPMGIPESAVLAPDYDLYGQLRLDDPNVQSPSGVGGNVYKDRGAIERADFTGPTASLVNPVDNDSSGLDTNSAVNKVLLVARRLTSFDIQLRDGGIGIDDSTVDQSKFVVQRTVGLTTTTLVPGTDYTLSYDATNKIARIVPIQGVWDYATYTIQVANATSAAPIKDLAGNVLQANEASLATKFVIQQSATPISPWQNQTNPYDVDGNGRVNGLDALLVINPLLLGQSGVIPSGTPATPYIDVTGDGSLTPQDAAQVIAYINSHTAAPSVAAALITTDDAVAAPAAVASTDTVALAAAAPQVMAAPASVSAATVVDTNPVAVGLAISHWSASDGDSQVGQVAGAEAVTSALASPGGSAGGASAYAAAGSLVDDLLTGDDADWDGLLDELANEEHRERELV